MATSDFWIGSCYTRLDGRLSDFYVHRYSFDSTNMTDLTNELLIRVTLLYVWRAEMGTIESKQFPRHGNEATLPTEAEPQHCKSSNTKDSHYGTGNQKKPCNLVIVPKMLPKVATYAPESVATYGRNNHVALKSCIRQCVERSCTYCCFPLE